MANTRGSNNNNNNNINGGSESGPLTFRIFLLYMAIPYLIGFYYSKYNVELVRMRMNQATEWIQENIFFESSSSSSSSLLDSSEDSSNHYRDLAPETCMERLLVNMHGGQPLKRQDNTPFSNLTIVLHKNGDAQPCGRTDVNVLDGLREMLMKEGGCPRNFEKYQAESLLTRLFHYLLFQVNTNSNISSTCSSGGGGGSSSSSSDNPSTDDAGLYGFCDAGPDRTPILPDHHLLVPIPHKKAESTTTSSLPCHFCSEHGMRVFSLPVLLQLARRYTVPSSADEEQVCTDSETCTADESLMTTKSNMRELHLYAVPAGRVFIFAPREVGQIISLPHVQGSDPNVMVQLQVLSTRPRIFEVINFFDRHDSDDLIENALQETRDLYRIKRSTTGDHELFARRTSESGFDTHGPVALKLKRRGMSLLGFHVYEESFTDGLQILRYNETTAYTSHFDWIDDDPNSDHDYQAAFCGSNRFATILLYMSDLDENEGGETVFPLAPTKSNETESQAIARLREAGSLEGITPKSWQESMIGECQTRFSLRPRAGRAVLFYSQNPDGSKDELSWHGACPVLTGDKWAANLWTWNAPRPGYKGHPIKKASP